MSTLLMLHAGATLTLGGTLVGVITVQAATRSARRHLRVKPRHAAPASA